MNLDSFVEEFHCTLNRDLLSAMSKSSADQLTDGENFAIAVAVGRVPFKFETKDGQTKVVTEECGIYKLDGQWKVVTRRELLSQMAENRFFPILNLPEQPGSA